MRSINPERHQSQQHPQLMTSRNLWDGFIESYLVRNDDDDDDDARRVRESARVVVV